jgi:DNA-binding transcriptional MerR regulator
VESKIENVDSEWISLIKQAKEQGISIEEIRIFFAQETSKLILQQEV